MTKQRLKASKRTFLSEFDEDSEIDQFDTDIASANNNKKRKFRRYFTDDEGQKNFRKLKMEKISEENEKLD